MIFNDIKLYEVYLWTNMHGRDYGRLHIGGHNDGPVQIVPPLPKAGAHAFCALHRETGDKIEVYADELSCCEVKPGATVCWGDRLEPGIRIKAVDVQGVQPFLIPDHVYTFRRWGNGFTIELEELNTGGFTPERFVYV